MITHTNLDRELSNNTKKLIKAACYIISLCFFIYAIIFNSGFAVVLLVFAGLPLCAMASSIKTRNIKFINNPIIMNDYSNNRKPSKGAFSPLTLYFIGIVLILVSFIGSFDNFRGPVMISGIATIFFNLASKRRSLH